MSYSIPLLFALGIEWLGSWYWELDDVGEEKID
jgi:hypothetical protein